MRGAVAQLVRAPACHAGGRRFEPDQRRQSKARESNGSRALFVATRIVKDCTSALLFTIIVIQGFAAHEPIFRRFNSPLPAVRIVTCFSHGIVRDNIDQ